MSAEAFDYIVVGAGSAGAVLAARLSEDQGRSVLLLEAGGSDRRLRINVPIGYGLTYHDARVNWKYTSEPVAGLGGRQSYWPRGKVLGGSSAINAMVYVRGHPSDYDRWGEAAPGWSWAEVAPVFRRVERWERGADEHRGGDGPLPVADIAGQVHPLCQHYLDAAGEAGIAINQDYNGASMDGAMLYQLTVQGGLRASTARIHLRPAMKRPNLTVRTRAHATRVIIERRRATGVAYRHDGRDQIAAARREVILAAGAVNSPQLLQLSGVGPGALLRRHGIEVVHDLRAVGRHLADHLGLDLVYRARVPTLNQTLGTWRGRALAGLAYLLWQRGPLALSINQAGGFVSSRAGLAVPDLQLYFSPLSYTRAVPGKRALMRPDRFPGFLFGFNPCRPTSEGEIAICSPDPMTPPAIQPNYLASDHDCALMLAGLRKIREIARMPALAVVIDAELAPGPEAVTDEALAGYVRDHAWTVFHPCCTCRMGTDPQVSVTDPSLRVHGIEGLRVADASVFPSIPSGNTNAPAIMLAEKAADIIRSAR